MVQRASVRQQQLMRDLGENVRRWRRINGWSGVELAERAAVTRETLRNLEAGTGSPRIDSLVAVLSALGIADALVTATDPYRSASARPRIDEILRSGGTL